MTHLSDGLLRRMLDEPLAAGDAEREHYGSCDACRSRAADFGRDAEAVARLLAVPELEVAPAAVLPRVRAALPARSRFALPRLPVRPLSVFAGAVVLLFTLSATGLADSFLQIFEPKRFVSIPVNEYELRALPDLTAYGTMTWSGPGKDDWIGGGPREIVDVAAARAASGLPLLTPARLPTAVGAPSYRVLRAARMTFTFSSQRAAEAAQRQGRALPPMPASIDGSSLFVDLGPLVFVTYPTVPGGTRTGHSYLMMAEARAPVVTSDRLSVLELRDYLLAQPGIPKTLAEQIRAIAEPESTLPIPVPMDRVLAREVRVSGAPALLFGDSTGLGSALFWRAGDVVRAIVGSLTDREVLDIANSLR